jgi:hypothetical protein
MTEVAARLIPAIIDYANRTQQVPNTLTVVNFTYPANSTAVANKSDISPSPAATPDSATSPEPAQPQQQVQNATLTFTGEHGCADTRIAVNQEGAQIGLAQLRL